MNSFTPSDAVLLHGEIFAAPIKAVWQIRLKQYLFSLVFIAAGLLIGWFLLRNLLTGASFEMNGTVYQATDPMSLLVSFIGLLCSAAFTGAGIYMLRDKQHSFSDSAFLLADEKTFVDRSTLAEQILFAAVVSNIEAASLPSACWKMAKPRQPRPARQAIGKQLQLNRG
jgi:hypothetical protein